MNVLKRHVKCIIALYGFYQLLFSFVHYCDNRFKMNNTLLTGKEFSFEYIELFKTDY